MKFINKIDEEKKKQMLVDMMDIELEEAKESLSQAILIFIVLIIILIGLIHFTIELNMAACLFMDFLFSMGCFFALYIILKCSIKTFYWKKIIVHLPSMSFEEIIKLEKTKRYIKNKFYPYFNFTDFLEEIDIFNEISTSTSYSYKLKSDWIKFKYVDKTGELKQESYEADIRYFNNIDESEIILDYDNNQNLLEYHVREMGSV